MKWNLEDREKRRHNISSGQKDQRLKFQKDRDRVLYSSAHRRLDDVAQVASSSHHALFHNRLSHTQKVAQIGQRLAEFRLREQPELCSMLGMDAEVVQAACLAHDLGHPPFGHIGEEELDALTRADGLADGFEGNAQSFRVVTKLALRANCPGLDLTRATLRAILKYPWKYRADDVLRSKKWGYYSSEQEDFDLASSWLPAELYEAKTAEAELMDWADDITYSVHDLEDFHRVGAIPWHLYHFHEWQPSNPHGSQLVENAFRSWIDPPADAKGRLADALQVLKKLFGYDQYRSVHSEPYEGTRLQRIALRSLTSALINNFVQAIKMRKPDKGNPRAVEFDNAQVDQMRILKQITRQFIHEDPALGAQQRGHREVIRALYADFKDDIEANITTVGWRPLRFVPKRFHYLIEDAKGDGARATDVPRLVADCIASLSEFEAFALYRRLRGYDGGSILDPIVH